VQGFKPALKQCWSGFNLPR